MIYIRCEKLLRKVLIVLILPMYKPVTYVSKLDVFYQNILPNHAIIFLKNPLSIHWLLTQTLLLHSKLLLQ